MDYSLLNDISAQGLAWVLIVLTGIFTVAWGLDARTHGQLVKKDITDKELQVHRLILIPSLLMEFSIVLMYWWANLMLPIFLAFYLVRTVHEFIDELHFHVQRCTKKESYLHLIMWCSVHIKTLLFFFWAYFDKFAGLELISPIAYIFYAILLAILGLITVIEFRR